MPRNLRQLGLVILDISLTCENQCLEVVSCNVFKISALEPGSVGRFFAPQAGAGCVAERLLSSGAAVAID